MNTALNYLVLADIYNRLDLKKASLDFIAKNVKALMATPEWKTTAHQYPAIFMEVTETLVNRFDTNTTPIHPQ